MMLTAAAIASVLLIGQSGATTAPPVMPRRAQPMVHRPAPPAGPDRLQPVRPRGNPGLWITTEDYPPRALREEREGVATIQLGVTPNGRAVTCGVRMSSGSDDLDEAACRHMLRRARFDPALDVNGVPAMGAWSIAVRWAIPEDMPGSDPSTPPAQATRETRKPWLDASGRGPQIAIVQQPLPLLVEEPGALARREDFRPPQVPAGDELRRLQAARQLWLLRLSVDGQGRVSGCTPLEPSLDPAFDALLCTRTATQVRFQPARDANGQPVGAAVYMQWAMPVAPPPPPVP